MNALERVVASSVAPPRKEAEVAESELNILRSARETLLGVEADARDELEARTHRLEWDHKLRQTGYRRIDPVVLTWRQSWSKYPMFAIYALNDPVVKINGADRPHGGVSPALPPGLNKLYDKVYRELDTRTTITSRFTGIIPGPVKEEIAKARPLFQFKASTGATIDNVFLMAEAEWERTVAPRPKIDWTRIDPLVVGWDGRDLWLIAHFNLTSIERYVVDEFPALPPGANPLGLPAHKE